MLTSASPALCWCQPGPTTLTWAAGAVQERSASGEGCPSSYGRKDSSPHLLGCPEGTTSKRPVTHSNSTG